MYRSRSSLHQETVAFHAIGTRVQNENTRRARKIVDPQNETKLHRPKGTRTKNVGTHTLGTSARAVNMRFFDVIFFSGVSITMFELTKDLKDEHLVIDTLKTKGLEYCLLSFCSSNTPQRIDDPDHVAFKLRGAFHSVDDAMEHAKVLDGTLHTYVAELYKWILIGNVTDDMSQEHHLVDMIRAHKKRNRDAREEFHTRKEKVMKEGLDSVDQDDIPPPPSATAKDKDPAHPERLNINPIRPGDTESKKTPTLNDRDTVTVPGLHYAVVSVVERDEEFQELETPRGVVGLKVRGIFETRDQAEDHMEKLGKLDTEFDMYLAELYRFHMLPPDIEKTEDVKYRDEYLNNLFGGCKKSEQEAKAFQAERDMQGVEKLVHPAEIRAAESNE